MYISFVSAFVCIMNAIEVGRVIDQQYRDVGGKPEFIEIPKKWRWLFYKPKEFYKRSNKLTKMSLIIYLIGYFGFIFQTTIIITSLIAGRFSHMEYISWGILLTNEILSMIVGFTMGRKYNKNMRKSYDYDFLSYYMEQLCGVCKRKCRIVSIIDEQVCEIEIGRIQKKTFKAFTESKVKIGDVRYAMHYRHPIDVKEP